MDAATLKYSFQTLVPGDKVKVIDGYWAGITTRVASKAEDEDYSSSWRCFAYWIYVEGGAVLVQASHLRLERNTSVPERKEDEVQS